MRVLNLGILAHVDAGKTTLTERLLYEAGVIEEIGSVDKGTSQTDFLPLERQRGITIKSAVISFVIGDVTVNLIDTPGHPDFIAEVERVLRILDGAVLVISAVEGVQVQTRVLMRTLQRLRIPTLFFINKIDRPGARDDAVLQAVSEKLTPRIVSMGFPSSLGSRMAHFEPYGAREDDFTARLVDLLSAHDPKLLAAYVEDEKALPYGRLRDELARQTSEALVHPVFFGSAATGAGAEPLMAGIEELLLTRKGDVDGPVMGSVFKVERGPDGNQIAYVRIFSGQVRTRDRLRFGRDEEAKVTAIAVFERGAVIQSSVVAAGQIGKLWGLEDVQIGDALGTVTVTPENCRDAVGGCYFAPPFLETAIAPVALSDKGALRVALAQLAEQDPLINVRQDDQRGEMYLSLYGEVQREVIQATLAEEFGLDVHFHETSVICTERPVGTGEAVERLGKGGNPFLATLGLRIDPAPEGTGLQVRLRVELASIPLYVYKSTDEFQKAMAHTVRDTLEEGLYGWRVRDCVVTVTQSGYAAPATGARDFRLLTPLVLMSALKEAGTRVCEPIHRFHLEVPGDSYGTVMPILARLEALLEKSVVEDAICTLEGQIQAGRVQDLRQRLPGATHGEGFVESDFYCYRPVCDPVPTRPRSDLNPLNRKEYLLHVVRRV